MAEIPDLGEHCALKNCNQLDFVPFRCEHCSSFYCRNHRLPDQHCCIVPDKNEKRKGDGEEELKFLCSMRGCFQRERTRIQCNHCNHNFCMRHRICEDHECGGLEKPSTFSEKQPIQLAIGKQKTETTQNQQQLRPQKKLSAEQQARLDRAEILKLKVKNPLKLAADQQFFLFAYLPQKNGGNRQVVVVSRQWSMLKAIWHIAEQLGFEYNDNLQAFKFQNSCEKMDEDMRPLPLDENVAKLLTNESELILRWKEE